MSLLTAYRLSRAVFFFFFVFSCVSSLKFDIPQADDANVDQRNTCGTTQVLQAMNRLLTSLSSEIRDLKKQVADTCQGREKEVDEDRGPSIFFGDGGFGDDSKTRGEKDDEEPDDFPSFSTKDEEEDPDDSEAGETVIDGISKWWETIVPFAPKPKETTTTRTTTTTSTSTTPRPLYVAPSGHDYYDYNNYNYPPPPRPVTYDPYYEVVTTTTPEPPSYLPPEPSYCPEPFRLFAKGCYMIFDDQRNWRTWGDAHALCQDYGGHLAAPWRFRELQSYLSQHYSDAFWVGASLDEYAGDWKWLSGRRVENDEWNIGQPSRNPSKKCLFISSWPSYKASNEFCGTKYPFICDHRQG